MDQQEEQQIKDDAFVSGFNVGAGLMFLSIVIGLVIVFAIATCANAGEIVEHVCNQGEHTVRVRTGTREVCEDPKLTLNPDDSYVQAKPVCHDEPDIESQRWSDWPECPGAERRDFVTFSTTGTSDLVFPVIK